MTTTLTTPRRPRSRPPLRRGPWWNLPELLEEMLPSVWEGDFSWMGGELHPSVDMAETDKTIELRMDLPGIQAKDVDIELVNNVLTIKGQREEVKEEKDKSYHRLERKTGSFCRSFALPMAVAETECVAEFQDGVLTVTLPKEQASQAKKIKIKS